MAVLEEHIIYERQPFWVFADPKNKQYTVYRSGPTCSLADSSYAYDADGLSIAKARCDYLARMAAL